MELLLLLNLFLPIWFSDVFRGIKREDWEENGSRGLNYVILHVFSKQYFFGLIEHVNFTLHILISNIIEGSY